MNARTRLLDEARKLLKVPFPRREAGERSGLLEFEDCGPSLPKSLSCSQFVRCVVDRTFGEGFWLRLVADDFASIAADGGARTMWKVLEATDLPEMADLWFFGDDDKDDWHVMMVVSASTLIGAVPGDQVREVPTAHFAEMSDRGARRMPIPPGLAGLANFPEFKS